MVCCTKLKDQQQGRGRTSKKHNFFFLPQFVEGQTWLFTFSSSSKNQKDYHHHHCWRL